ncbi:hypothetical protein KGF56_003374 [Candida oxycetoniae]|uniref:Uncharacterized protein n=1 Tax=Candida oxycetoniae TaxID=497107 RepID=A0AAI9SVW5_9ASCO|nr:uncharacterized protein KGF56_003374 [Candida oxycetoniae]KAI3403814.2 hypothetical protein KGF56_003374 [Candida oxycetoniae]
MNKKKHVLDENDDDDFDDQHIESRSGKRIKLDSLLEGLHLDDDMSTHPFISQKEKCKLDSQVPPTFNSIIDIGGIFKKSNVPQSYTSSQMNSFINERLAEHFEKMITSAMKIIRWYNYKFLIILIYKKWFVKLFNRFLKKYNLKNNSNIRLFSSYDKIVRLIPEGFLTWNDLKSIIYEENRLEIQRLQLKEQKRQSQKDSKVIQMESAIYKDLGYNYWDNLNFDKDLDMLEADEKQSKVEVLDDDPDNEDIAMET